MHHQNLDGDYNISSAFQEGSEVALLLLAFMPLNRQGPNPHISELFGILGSSPSPTAGYLRGYGLYISITLALSISRDPLWPGGLTTDTVNMALSLRPA